MTRTHTCARDQQQALHVTDYYCAAALSHLRSIGACGRKATRKLTDIEWDYDMYSQENGDGFIY